MRGDIAHLLAVSLTLGGNLGPLLLGRPKGPFRTQLEALERLADHRQTHRHTRSLGQALTVFAQQRVIVLDHELTQHRESRRIQA